MVLMSHFRIGEIFFGILDEQTFASHQNSKSDPEIKLPGSEANMLVVFRFSLIVFECFVSLGNIKIMHSSIPLYFSS